MNRLLQVLSLLCACGIAATSAQAAGYYVAQTATGNGSGNDANDCLAVTWITTTGTYGAGDTNYLVGTFTSGFTVLNGGSAAGRMTIYFMPGANITNPTNSAIVMGSLNYWTIDGGQNGLIQCTANGSALANQFANNGISGTPTIGNITIQNVWMTNLFVNMPGGVNAVDGQGIKLQGVFSNLDIHGCHISQINKGIWCVYNAGVSHDWLMYSNTYFATAYSEYVGNNGTGCTLYNLTQHDINTTGQSLWDTTDDSAHENGIYDYCENTSCSLSNVFIYNGFFGPDIGGSNGILGGPTACIHLSAAAGTGYSVTGVQIYNNVLWPKFGFANEGLINLASGITNAVIAQNSEQGTASGNIGINTVNSTNVVAYNNIFSDGPIAEYVQVSVSGSPVNWYAFSPPPGPLLAIFNPNFNLFYNITGGGTGWGGQDSTGGQTLKSFALWTGFYGMDTSSSNPSGEPPYRNPNSGDFHLTNTVPLGTNVSSLIAGAAFDKDGNPRGLYYPGAYMPSLNNAVFNGTYTLGGTFQTQ